MTDHDWITVTTNGIRKWVRRSRIDSFGTIQITLAGRESIHSGYVELNGREIEVRESEAELALLLGAAPSEISA